AKPAILRTIPPSSVKSITTPAIEKPLTLHPRPLTCYPADKTLGRTVSRRDKMALRIGDTAPDFEAETTQGKIKFHDWIGNSYAILFSHPKDFTPVCTTELGYMAKLDPEFKKRNVKIIGLSVDPVGDHDRWKSDIRDATGGDVNYPMIGDHDLHVAKLYDMLPGDAGATSQGRTAANNATVRTV